MSAPDHRADQGYSTDQIAAYGSSEQPAVAARMAPHLRMTYVGTGCSVLSVITAAVALANYPQFSDESGVGWAVTALVATLVMLAICVIQVAVWRRAMASWRGIRPEDLHAEKRLSWIAHLSSYLAAVVGLLACMAGSASAGWTATAAVLLAITLVLLLAAQVLAGVQYLRPSGPPGTVPTHMRRMMERQGRRR
jgi:hypothetical protein